MRWDDFGTGTHKGRDWEGKGADLDGTGRDNNSPVFSPRLVSWRLAILLFGILLFSPFAVMACLCLNCGGVQLRAVVQNGAWEFCVGLGFRRFSESSALGLGERGSAVLSGACGFGLFFCPPVPIYSTYERR